MLEEFNRALKLVERNPKKAASLFKAHLKKYGEFKETLLNLAVCYKYMRDYDTCGKLLLRANDPKVPFSDGTFIKAYPQALNNLGLISSAMEDEESAIQFYTAALAEDPLYYDALWNLAISKLRNYCSDVSEDLAICWKLYDYRFKRQGAEPLKNAKSSLKLWDGIRHVSSLVVLSEQGFGDSFMFGRYLKYLEAYADKIWVQCDMRLSNIFSKYNTCVDVNDSDATHGIPLGSLGKILDHIPAGDWLSDRYVPAKPSDRLRIACVWAGNSNHANDSNRSTNSHNFLRLSKYADLYTIGPNPSARGFKHLDGFTWDDTIRNLEQVDLVISVDTSIVHLCGSLGKPCWVIMPLRETDFRWGNSSMGYNNVWYNSVTVIRNQNSWFNTFDHVEKLVSEIN